MEEVSEKAEPPYSGLTDDEEACACTRSRWCGGRAFADEHRLAGVPTGRAATLVFSLVCIASAIDCVASLCTTGMRIHPRTPQPDVAAVANEGNHLTVLIPNGGQHR